MKITLNGKPHTIKQGTNVSGLLKEIGLAEKPVVVELNQEAVIPKKFPETPVHDGDKVEIVMLAAGG